MGTPILVTGATGFVGRHLCRALSDLGCDVIAVVREGSDTARMPVLPRARFVSTASVFAESSEWWREVLTGIDTVVHLAWYVEHNKYLTAFENLACVTGSIDMVKGAVDAGVKRIVGVGTCFEYDVSFGYLNTETPLKPQTLYAASKAALYLILTHWLQQTNVSFAWCRLFYLFGDGEHEGRFVPYLRNALAAGKVANLTEGHQVRDYLNVRDAASMIADVAVGEIRGPVNICSGIPRTIRELAEGIADEYGRRDLLNFGGKPENVFDPPAVVGVR